MECVLLVLGLLVLGGLVVILVVCMLLGSVI